MDNLYEISKQIQDLWEMVDEDGVLLPEFDTMLTDLQMKEIEKFRNIWWMLKNLKAEQDMFEKEYKDMKRKANIAKNKQDRLKNWLKFVLESKPGNAKITAWLFTFSLRAFPKVVVDDLEILDDIYKKVTVEPMKTEIKNALKEWEVKWARIEKSNSVIVR